MKQMYKVFSLVIIMHTSIIFAQNSTILRGVYLFGRGDVNFGQMKDSLHLNSFQTTTGYAGNETQDNLALHNYAGLKVYNQRQYLATQSSAQRMVYQAEQVEDLTYTKNIFAEKHPNIHLENFNIYVSPPAPAGYMVKSAAPNYEYHYGDRGTNYYASFRLKVDGGSSSTQVADCIVYCLNTNSLLAYKQVLVSDLSPVGSYHDVVVQFTLDPAPTNPASGNIAKMLTGGTVQSTQSSSCTNVDLQVYWNGNVTTYLDRVTVEDELAVALFNGANDNAIMQDASQFTANNYPLHDKFYLVDEPPVSAFLGFNYVGNLIKNTLGNIPQAGTVAANYYAFERFLNDGTPYQLMVDIYPITSDIPHPSITDNIVANAAGIATWDYNIYLDSLQSKVDHNFLPNIRSATNAAHVNGKPLILIPQLHGVIDQRTSTYKRHLKN
ncbi:MAG: hypothetical protein C0417_05925 [Chlorobiaceae bacterium]|nr:hypothetical protein [Chlorobiaceae bacterium]